MDFSTHEIVAYIASFIAVLVEWRYIYTILTKKTIPNFTGWFIMAVSMSIVFFSSLSAWAKESIYLIGVLASLHIVEATLAFFYGKFYITKFEIIILIISCISILIWMWTDNPLYAIIINTIVDAFWMLSISYKLFRFPETEDKIAWIVSDCMYIINLFSISVWNIENALFVVVNVITGTIIVFLTFRKMPFLQKIDFQFKQLIWMRL